MWETVAGWTNYPEYDERSQQPHTLTEHYPTHCSVDRHGACIGLMESLTCARLLASDIYVHMAVYNVTLDNGVTKYDRFVNEGVSTVAACLLDFLP
jgi:hypothetical protein